MSAKIGPAAFFSHHKCGTRWLLTFLTRAAALNGRRLFHTDFGDEPIDLLADIVLSGNAEYRSARAQGLSGFHVIRNPLNVITSAYYSHLAVHTDEGWPELGPQRAVLNAVSRSDGMFLTLTFVEREDIAKRAIGPLLALRRWDYTDPKFVTVRMEDLVASPSAVMRPLLTEAWGSESFDLPPDSEMAFERFSGNRPIGAIDNSSHYRSGSTEAWRDELPPAIIQYVRSRFDDLLKRYYPDALIDI